MLKMTEFEAHLFLLEDLRRGVPQVTARKFTTLREKLPKTLPPSETTWYAVEQLSLFTEDELQMCSKGCFDPRSLVIS